MQLQEPVGAGSSNRFDPHEADLQCGNHNWSERLVWEVQLTLTCGWVDSLFLRLPSCRVNWW